MDDYIPSQLQFVKSLGDPTITLNPAFGASYTYSVPQASLA